MTIPRKRIVNMVAPIYIPGLKVAPADIHLARAAEHVYTWAFREVSRPDLSRWQTTILP